MQKKNFNLKVIIFLFFIIFLINSIYIKNKNYKGKFVFLIRKTNFSTDGLLAYYYFNLGCVYDYIINGYIPIIDLISHPNIFNGFNTSVFENPWEEFFYQPFNYTLENVKKYGKNIKIFECYQGKMGPTFDIFKDINMKKFWHNIANKYLPIKREILIKADYYFNFLFKQKKNILGILIRGTDYIAKKPTFHAVQPTPEMVFEDINIMNSKYKYESFFLTTEDDLIREKFIKKYGKKLKYIKSKININCDYKKKELLAFNKNIKGNLPYMKIYLINIIILSKCLDIITSRTGGSLVAFIWTKGFRNIKVYHLGAYK